MNDADRLGHDPAMRWIVGGHAVTKQTASASQMGRFETEFLATDDNTFALAELSGLWIDRVHGRRPPKKIVLDMDSSVSPTYGDQEGTAYNGHFGCACYHPLFLFNQFDDLERCRLRPGNVHSADGWRDVLEPVVERYGSDRQIACAANHEQHYPCDRSPSHRAVGQSRFGGRSCTRSRIGTVSRSGEQAARGLVPFHRRSDARHPGMHS